MDDQTLTILAKMTYAAYGQVTDFKNYQGLPMPEWDALTPTIQAAWKAATQFAYNHGAGSVLIPQSPDHK